MGRARGANALLNAKFESVYGTPPGGNFLRMPFVTSNLGAEQGLIESDLLGQGRESYDPTLDVVEAAGDLTVPVDVRRIGEWLRLFFGAAVSGAEGAASLVVTFSGQPTAESTITINGTAFTAKASGATGAQFNIGVNLAATLTNLATALNGSADTDVDDATYAGGATTLTITHDTVGLGGNAFTVEADAAMNCDVTDEVTLSGGTNSHVFTSGASTLPSMSVEVAMPDVPSYGMNYGIRGNTMRIAMSRRGLLNAVLGLIAKGEADPVGTSAAGTPTTVSIERFAQATGSITKDGVALGSVQSAEFTYSNNLDPVDTIQESGEIEDADPAMATSSGSIVVRFKDHTLLAAATGRDPVALTFGWTFEAYSLVFTLPRVFLPRVKRPISGPAGVQATFNWQGSGADGHVMTVELVNDVAAYA